MKVWVLAKEWDYYGDDNREIAGVFETFDKAVTASDMDIKQNPGFLPHEWEIDSDGSHTRSFDYLRFSEHYGKEITDEYYGFYRVTEMDVQ